jgi:preprotein translocase subunit SecF
MELLRDTNFDFMKYRKFWVIVSLALVGLGIISVFFLDRLNIGVDFAGGTQINLQFREQPEIDRLRTVPGLEDASIQRFGTVEEKAVTIRTRLAEEAPQAGPAEQVQGDDQARAAQRVLAALDQALNPGRAGNRPDLNRVGDETVATLLVAADPDGRRVQGTDATLAHYKTVAERIMDKRKEVGLFSSWQELQGINGVSPQVVSSLQRQADLGAFAVTAVESVGPQIGGELRRQGFLAVALSLLGMLGYIWIRFELRFGVGAIMACIHDVLVTLGLFALAGYEFNLTTIAAFLTLIGYSVNDTVVILDRIRENMRKSRRKPLIDTMNESINQTLSRTILTGGSTLFVLGALWILGGEVIKGFAFVMFVGILVGTYSSIYVASPFALLWERLAGPKARRAAADSGRIADRDHADREAQPVRR